MNGNRPLEETVDGADGSRPAPRAPGAQGPPLGCSTLLHALMSTPVRLSNELLVTAREAGAQFHRSIAQQVEHWAQVGRAVEAALVVSSVGRLKDLAMRPDLDQLLDMAETSEGRARALDRIATRGLPSYSADPDCHDGVIEHRVDGTSARGRFVNRVFVAEQDSADEDS